LKFVKIGERPSSLPLAGFQELVIDSQKTNGLLLFRLAENPIKLIVHEKVIDSLAKNSSPDGWGVSAIELKEKS